MKFDKLMNILYRAFVIGLAIFIVVGCVASCFHPITACALIDGDAVASDIKIFYEDYKREMDRVERAIASDIQNGTIDESSAIGREYMSALALQSAVASDPALYNVYLLANAYNEGIEEANKFVSYLNNNPTMDFSGSAISGLYRTSADGAVKICNISTIPYTNTGCYSTFISAPDFTFSAVAPSGVDVSFVYQTPNYRTPYFEYGMSNYSSTDFTFGYSGTGLGLSDIGTGHGYGFSRKIYISYSAIPVLSSSFSLSNISESSPICGYGYYTTLPNETVDTDTPWNYYNDYIIPYMQTNFPNVTANYYIYPNGYVPFHPDPTEPPTFPNGGINIENQYNIGINIIYPTDASGQPVTDASGETVTETEYITDTSPLDGEYSFKMPTLARLNMVEATLPNPDISDYSNGINFVWNMCYNILTDSGFMPVVMIVFALALFGFILWKLGG